MIIKFCFEHVQDAIIEVHDLDANSEEAFLDLVLSACNLRFDPVSCPNDDDKEEF